MTNSERVFSWNVYELSYSLRFLGDEVRLYCEGEAIENPFKSPYKPEDLAGLNAALTPEKKLLVVHPNYPPYVLWTADQYWFFEPVVFDVRG